MATSSRKSQGVTLLIDADVLAYTAANGEQPIYDWGDGVTSVSVGTLEDGIADVLREVERLKEKLHADRVVLCLSHPGTRFREAILPSYKANRVTKPLLVDPIRDALVTQHGAVRRPGLEGDDVIGIYATHPYLIPGPKVVVSIDKDMKQIPGVLYNPGKDTLTKISREEADYYHFFQTLTGDPTDNYKGLPGCGPVGAAKILSGNDGAWPAIVEAYKAKGLTEADALVQARVARILRSTDYDFKRKVPILWQPQR